MVDKGIGDYFISDIDDEMLDEDDEIIATPVVVPQQPAEPGPAPTAAVVPPSPDPVATAPVAPATAVTAAAPVAAAQPSVTSERPQATAKAKSREERLADALDDLMQNSPDIQAAALVSMDGFTMASALPEGMHEDRVGAMSAAILGLGERAATELGRGHLTEVFIEGDDGFVVLIAAGNRAVLTTLAERDSKLGLVLFDMKAAAELITEILG